MGLILGPSLIILKAGGLISGLENGPGNGPLKKAIFRAQVERCRAVVGDLNGGRVGLKSVSSMSDVAL